MEIASSKQIATKTLRKVITDLKQGVINDEVSSYAWLPTNAMWADILTKEKQMPLTFEKVMTTNSLALDDMTVNRITAFGQEVRMTNIQNCANTPVLDT